MGRWSAWERLREYDRIAGIGGIARRYLAMNAFDGVVTILGLLAGGWVSGIEDPRIVLLTGLATGLAMATSGFWGAYLTEASERKQQLDELESQTLTSLTDTKVGRASRTAVAIVTIIDGSTPLLTSIIVLVPFMLPPTVIDGEPRYFAGFGIAMLLLFGLGLFLGRISRKSAFGYAIKTLLAGLIAVGLGFALHLVGD